MCRRSTLVAAMMRTSTLIVSMPPSGMNSRSWITRSSLACVSSGMVADLVEEDRAVVGELEKAFCRIHGAGKRAFDVAEQVRIPADPAAIAPQLTVTNGRGRAVEF